MIRVSSTVRAYLSGVARKPGAITVTMAGEKMTPASEMTTRMTDRSVKATRASSKASSRDFVLRYSVKTGTKAIVSEPSANRRLSRFGIRKATKKASVARPAPKKRATMTSRMKPKTRESIVASPTTPAALATRWFSVSWAG